MVSKLRTKAVYNIISKAGHHVTTVERDMAQQLFNTDVLDGTGRFLPVIYSEEKEARAELVEFNTPEISGIPESVQDFHSHI